MTVKKREKQSIGWREWVEFPEFKNIKLKAKVDSGARTSSLHAHKVKIVQRRGRTKVRFEVYPNQKDQKEMLTVEAPLVDCRSVKSSSGHVEKRHIITTKIKIGEESWPIEISLTNRDLMGFRMLLGRQALRNRFTIDVSKSFLATNTVSKKRTKKL